MDSPVKYPALHPAALAARSGVRWVEANLGTPSDSRSGLDRVGAVSGLNLGAPAAGDSGTVQVDVASLGGLGGEVLGQEIIAQRLQ